MKAYLPKIPICSSFLKRQFPISAAEYAYGFDRNWVEARDIVDSICWWWGKGHVLAPSEQKIAGLLENELWQIRDLLSPFLQPNVSESLTSIRSTWLYLLLACLYENREIYEDAFEEIEKIYDYFEFPTEMQSLVRYMPPQKGQKLGLQAILSNWETYLTQRKCALLKEHKLPIHL